MGLSDDKTPRSLENTDYFGTAKITKTRISNVISNTFQNHNLIRRNISALPKILASGEYAKHKFQKIRRLIEVVTTRRS